MRPPLSYVPLLPLTMIIVIVVIVVDLFNDTNPKPIDGTTFKGIVSDRRETNSGQQLTVVCRDTTNHRFLARITVPTVAKDFSVGDSVTFNGVLKVPKLRNQHENDYPKRLRAQGIDYTGYIMPDSINVIGTAHNLYWDIRRLQPILGNLIKRSSLSDDACEFLIATLTGDTSIIEPDTRAVFSSSGLAHILALSGLHVAILSVAISIALFPLTMFGQRKLRIAFTLFILWIYVVLTGLSPSVTRAVIMATTLGVGIMIGRRNISFNSLLLAAIIILIADPDSLFQPGFQLSFCAVAAILLIVPLIPLGREITGIVRYIISVAVVTIAATLGTGIISAYHFHTFPIYFVIANIPVLALLPFLMGGGVIIMVLEALGYDPVILCEMVNDLFNVIFKITSWVASLPHATIDRLYFPWWISLPYFAALGASIFFLAKPSIKRAISPTLLCAITVIMFLMVNEDCDGEDFFITRSSTETSAIYRNGNQAFLITTALGRKAEAVAESYRRNFSDYLDSHKVDTLIIANDSIMYRGLKRVGQKVTVNNTVYHFIANNEISELNARVNYAVVCRGFSGDVMKMVRKLEPDTVLLSYDLHPRRHKRYADSLTSNKTPYRSLKISQ